MLPLILEGNEELGRERIMVEFDWRFVDGLRLKTIRTHEYKLTMYAHESYGELYDLRNDPSEFTNLWDDPAYAEVKHDLTMQLLHMLVDSESKLPPRLVPN